MKHILPFLWFVTFGAWVELFEERTMPPDPLVALFDLATSIPGIVVRCVHVTLAFGVGIGWGIHALLS